MASGNTDQEDKSLESLLNAATNPARRDEDWESIMAFCDQINKELEGPQIAVRLLAHKIQSPQEREALFALAATESCVKNCGSRFHQEIGKFRFLNEMIKVISPKYLGNLTTEKVKKRCVELLYSWTNGLSHETKIKEAYTMLKTQGILKEDPVYLDKTFEPPPPEKPRKAVFEDDEKSKLLAKLLKSSHPEDLQAANRLIKNMVKQDEQRMEKVSRRINELEAVNNNVKLLGEMLEHYRANRATEADRDLMKDLVDTLDKKRPSLFRLASDTDEKDNDGMVEILSANDEVTRVMNMYRQLVEGETDMPSSPVKSGSNSLLDLKTPSPQKSGESLLAGELAALGLTETQTSSSGETNNLDILNELLGNSGGKPGSSMGDAVFGTIPVQSGLGTNPIASARLPATQAFSELAVLDAPLINTFSASPAHPIQPNMPLKPPPAPAQPAIATGILDGSNKKASQQSQHFIRSAGMESLDALGKTMLEQSLPPDKKLSSSHVDKGKVTVNQLAQKTAVQPLVNQPTLLPQTISTAPSSEVMQPTPVLKLIPAVGDQSKVAPPTPPSSLTASPQKTVANIPIVQPLNDIFVPLDAIKPGTQKPVTAYDKNGLRIILHFALNSPRPDVKAMIVSVMSTNTSPVKNFTFQAAVPKVMKVKLQPPSATDLPAYNPILPPSAITQVLLLANPQQEQVRVKYKISYTMDDKNTSDVGDVDSFPGLYDSS